MRQFPSPSDLDPTGDSEPMVEDLGPMVLPNRSLGVVALVLFELFATVLAGSLWPIQ